MTRAPDPNQLSPIVVEEPRFRPYPPPRPRFPFVALVLLAVVFAAIGAGGFALFTRHRELDPAAEAERLRTQRQQLEMKETAARQQEKVALARARCQVVLEEGKKVLTLADDFGAEHELWHDNVTALLTDDRGRGLAAKPPYVLTFRKLYDQPRPPKEQADAIRARIELILEPVRTALADEATLYVPGDQATASLEAERNTLLALIQRCREPRLQLDALAAQAGAAPSSAPTLQKALEQLAAKEADERAKLVAAAEDNARAEGDKAIAEARAKKIQQADQATVDEIRAGAELEKERAESRRKEIAASQAAERQRGEAEAARIREAAEKEARVGRAKSDEVKRLLAPFLSDGYNQPGEPAGSSTKKGPVSLSKLRAFGALEENANGLRLLITWAVNPQMDNVRPRWSYHPLTQYLTPAQLEEVKKAQGYLRDLGPTLVEEGMLSP